MSVMEGIYREDCQAAGVGAQYEKLLKAGNNPGFAAMLALRSPPAFNGSERAILEGDVRNHGLSHLPEFMQKQKVLQAKRAGINITGKVYKGTLADQRGGADPDAWVGGVDDVIAACKRKGKNLMLGGRPAVQHPELPPKPDCPLSNEAIRDLVPEFLRDTPDFKGDTNDLKAAITEKHGAPATKRTPKPKRDYTMVPDLDYVD